MLQCSEKNIFVNKIYIGSLALQEISGMTIIVFFLIDSLLIVLEVIIAGTEHPNPITIEIKLFPDSPTNLKILSVRYATRAIYPDSSIIVNKKNIIIICGKNESNDPTPEIMPFISNDVIQNGVVVDISIFSIILGSISPKKSVISDVIYDARNPNEKENERKVIIINIGIPII